MEELAKLMPVDQSSSIMIAPSSSTTVTSFFSSATLPRLAVWSLSSSASSAERLAVVRVGRLWPLDGAASVVVAVTAGVFLGMV